MPRKISKTASPQPQPLVSAVMITGKSVSRIPFALAAAACLMEQRYGNLELVIVNHGASLIDFLEKASLNIPHGSGCLIREYLVNRGEMTLGDLRNITLEKARGDFIVQWDDDDWSHPVRICEQLRFAMLHNCAVTLENQLRYDFETRNGYAATPRTTLQKQGLPNTIMFPKGSNRYQSISIDEDGVFLKGMDKVHVIKNPPEWHIRFFHGDNVCSKENIMKNLRFGRNKRIMSNISSKYLTEILKKHYQFAER